MRPGVFRVFVTVRFAADPVALGPALFTLLNPVN